MKKREKVLLVGNDINNATADYSWTNLLKDLITYSKLRKIPSMDGKPFPLFYEEILLNSAKIFGTEERDIKAYIAEKTKLLQPNRIHATILELGIKTIFTTNYDLTLEKTLTEDIRKIKNSGVIKENLYSLFRANEVEDFRFWHIHGYETSPASITLGYEHYSGYLQQMRNYVAVGTKGTYRGRDFQSLVRRVKNNTVLHESWVDYFFTHDMHIVGLNLDFVEMHLWWLLTFRARMIIFNKLKIQNTIYYYYPKKYALTSKHKLQLLSVNEVKTIALEMKGEDRAGYYKRVLNTIKKEER